MVSWALHARSRSRSRSLVCNHFLRSPHFFLPTALRAQAGDSIPPYATTTLVMKDVYSAPFNALPNSSSASGVLSPPGHHGATMHPGVGLGANPLAGCRTSYDAPWDNPLNHCCGPEAGGPGGPPPAATMHTLGGPHHHHLHHAGGGPSPTGPNGLVQMCGGNGGAPGLRPGMMTMGPPGTGPPPPPLSTSSDGPPASSANLPSGYPIATSLGGGGGVITPMSLNQPLSCMYDGRAATLGRPKHHGDGVGPGEIGTYQRKKKHRYERDVGDYFSYPCIVRLSLVVTVKLHVHRSMASRLQWVVYDD